MKWAGTWHPLAERFPMLGEDDLREMAASITQHGQFVPCRMDRDGVGLDGRNRAAACTLAGVKPRWEIYDGDPIAFIVEVNAKRRHLTTGQRAMATAIGLLEAGKRSNGRFQVGSVPEVSAETKNAWRLAISRAGLILDHAPELADQVLAGDVALDGAHKTALERRDRAARLAELDEQLAGLVQAGVVELDDAEERIKTEARIAKLDDDLVARVNGGTLAIDEAELITEQREQRLEVWASEIRRAITVLEGLAGYPIPTGLKNKLDADEQATIALMLAGVPNQENA